jgi:hypothetical protein
MKISIFVVQTNVDDCVDCRFAEPDGRRRLTCEGDPEHRDCPDHGVPEWCPGLADNEISRVQNENEKLKDLLREAEPFVQDVRNQRGFHALEAGDLHDRIWAALKGWKNEYRMISDPFRPTTADRLARLEALQGIGPAPTSWGVTAARIRLIREKRGASLEGARQLLIKNFGLPLPEEEK